MLNYLYCNNRFRCILLLAAMIICGKVFATEQVKINEVYVFVTKNYEPNQVPKDEPYPLYGRKLAGARIPLEEGTYELKMPSELQEWECTITATRNDLLQSLYSSFNFKTQCFIKGERHGVGVIDSLPMSKNPEFNIAYGNNVVNLKRVTLLTRNIKTIEQSIGHKPEEAHVGIYGLYK